MNLDTLADTLAAIGGPDLRPNMETIRGPNGCPCWDCCAS